VLRRDRVAILPDRGATGGPSPEGRTIHFAAHTADAVEPFVSALWDHMGAWGIAGHGMYWRPVLQVHVAPDAHDRAAEFKQLLEGSGLEFVQKGAVVR
jgi:hypothetical protein